MSLDIKVVWLLRLEIMVVTDNLGDKGLVWVRHMVVRHQILICFLDVLPALDSLEQAKVCKNNRWSPSDSGGAMNVNFMSFVVNHVV